MVIHVTEGHSTKDINNISIMWDHLFSATRLLQLFGKASASDEKSFDSFHEIRGIVMGCFRS
jgi:hypothetical protein